MKKAKKFLSMFLVLALMVTGLVACGGKEEETAGDAAATATTAPTATKAADPTATPTPEPTQEPARDLGGMEIIIGNWWSNSDDLVPATTYEEELVAYRKNIQDTYNCTIHEVNICGWGEMQELCSSSIMAGDPKAQIFILDSSFAASLLSQGLFYDISSLPSFDPTDERWNQLVLDAMTFDGKTYGFAVDYEPRAGIFFNKRLFEEAGIDPNLPYDLQAAGNWNWDAFEDLCKKLTRDVDNDGEVDTYGLATFNKDFVGACVYSNNAAFVKKDENGLFVNATGDPNFLEALQYARKLNDEGYVMPQPADSNWDWFKAAFHDGQAAMRVAEEYTKGELQDMQDDFGFVMFPAGVNGSMMTAYRENILVIPSSYTPEEADNILFAYQLWTDPVPGYEDEESWKLSAYAQYRDERAVDETLTMMRAGKNGVMRMEAYIAGLETGDVCYSIWNQETTPAELIEKVKQPWDSLINDANAAMKK